MKRSELIAALARAERLGKRNEEQRDRIRETLAGMADHATEAADGLAGRVAAGDPEATTHAKRALFGRTLARKLLDV